MPVVHRTTRSGRGWILILRRPFQLIGIDVHDAMPLLARSAVAERDRRRLHCDVVFALPEDLPNINDEGFHAGHAVGDVIDRANPLVRAIIYLEADDLRTQCIPGGNLEERVARPSLSLTSASVGGLCVVAATKSELGLAVVNAVSKLGLRNIAIG
jgi:hypothetical protein